MDIEIRNAEFTENEGRLIGEAIVFNKASRNLGGFVEVIDPAAFDQHLSTNPDIRALVEHNGGQLLGRTSSGTLKLTKSASGISVDIDPPDTQVGRDCVTLVRRGDLKNMSFGFRCLKDRFDTATNPPTRHVLKAELFEVTITANPAYMDSSIAMRSLDTNKPKDLELYFQVLERLYHV